MTQVTAKGTKQKPVIIIGMNIGTCSAIHRYSHLMLVKDFIPSSEDGRFFLPCDWLIVNYDTGWIREEDEIEDEEGAKREVVLMMPIVKLISRLTSAKSEPSI